MSDDASVAAPAARAQGLAAEVAATRAGDILGRLYGGATSTYRSMSLHAQLEAGGRIAAINTIRAAVDWPPLSSPS